MLLNNSLQNSSNNNNIFIQQVYSKDDFEEEFKIDYEDLYKSSKTQPFQTEQYEQKKSLLVITHPKNKQVLNYLSEQNKYLLPIERIFQWDLDSQQQNQNSNNNMENEDYIDQQVTIGFSEQNIDTNLESEIQNIQNNKDLDLEYSQLGHYLKTILSSIVELRYRDLDLNKLEGKYILLKKLDSSNFSLFFDQRLFIYINQQQYKDNNILKDVACIFLNAYLKSSTQKINKNNIIDLLTEIKHTGLNQIMQEMVSGSTPIDIILKKLEQMSFEQVIEEEPTLDTTDLQKIESQYSQSLYTQQNINNQTSISLDYLLDLFTRVKIMQRQNEDIQIKHASEISNIREIENFIELKRYDPKNLQLIQNILNDYSQNYIRKQPQKQFYDQTTNQLYVNQTFNEGILQHSLFESHCDALNLIKYYVKPQLISQIVDIQSYNIDAFQKSIYQMKGVCSLQQFSDLRSKMQIKWYQNQDDLLCLYKKLIHFISIIHQSKLHLSNISLENIGLKQQNNNNQFIVFINNFQGISNNWKEISVFNPYFFPQEKNCNLSEFHRKYCDYYQVGRIIQLLMLSSLDVSDESLSHNNQSSIKKSIKLLSGYYDEKLIQILQLLLQDPISFDIQLFLSQLVTMQKSLNDPKYDHINDKENSIQQLIQLQSNNDISRLSPEQILDILNISNMFKLTYGKIVCEHLQQQPEKLQQLQQFKPEIHQEICYEMAKMLEYNSQFKYAIELYKTVQNSGLEKDFRIQAEILTNLGYCYMKLNCLQEAEKYYLDGLEQKRMIYQENELSIIKSKHKLGYLYLKLLDYEKGEQFYKEAEQSFETIQVIKNDTEYLMVLKNLAIIYSNIGKFGQSDYYFGKIITLKKRYNEIDLELADIMEQQANLNQVSLNQSEIAVGLYKEAIKIKQRLMSDKELNNLAVAETYFNIAYELSLQSERENQNRKKSQEGESYIIKCIEIRSSIMGEDDIDVAKAYSILANLLIIQNKYDQAEKYTKKSYMIYKDFYGPEHHLTQESQKTLQELEQSRDSYTQYYKDAKILKEHFGKQEEDYINVLKNNRHMSVDEIISKVKQGELKIQLDSGDMVEKKVDQSIKDGGKKLKEVFGGEPEDYYNVLDKNRNVTADQIIQRVRAGTLQFTLDGKELRPLDVIEQEEYLKKKAQFKVKSGFFPNIQHQTHSLFRDAPIKKKILEFNEKIKSNSTQQLAFTPHELQYFDQLLSYVQQLVQGNTQNDFDSNELDLLKNKLIYWPIEYQVPIFDILKHIALSTHIKRLLIGENQIQIFQTLCSYLSGEQQVSIPVIGVFLTFLNNLLKNASYLVIDNQKQILSSLFQLLDQRKQDIKENKNFQLHLCNFFFNFSLGIYENAQKIYKKQFIDKIIDSIIQNLNNLENSQIDDSQLQDFQLKYLISLAHIILAQVNVNKEVLTQDKLNKQVKVQKWAEKAELCLKDIQNMLTQYVQIFQPNNNIAQNQ